MGADATGLMLLFVQLIGVINIAEMGVGTATASLLYKPLSDNDKPAVSRILESAAKIYKAIATLVFLVGVVTGIVIYYTIPSVSLIEYSFLFWIIYVSNTAISYLFAHYLILLTADQKYYITRTIQGGAKILCILLQLMVIVIYKNFLFYILCESIFLLIQFVLFRNKIKKDYGICCSNASQNHTTKDEFDAVKKKIKNVFFHKIGGVLVFNTDYIIISKFLTLTSVTIYSSYMMIFQALAMIVNILGNSVTASVGNFLSDKDTARKKIIWNQIIIVFFYISTCLTLITLLTITDFVRLWIGSGYTLDNMTLYALLFNLFVLISRVSIDIIKNASGEFGDIYLPIIEGVVNIVVSILLVTKIGFIGVVIGTAISNSLIICLAKPAYLYKRVLKGGIIEFLYSILKPLTLSVLSAAVVISCSNLWSNTSDFYHWSIKTSTVSVFVVCIVSCFFLLSVEFRFVFKKVVLLLINKK